MKTHGVNQKLKMLYLLKIFYEETDDTTFFTLQEIIQKLADYGVMAERKTLYVDFDELRRFGVDIISEKIGLPFALANPLAIAGLALTVGALSTLSCLAAAFYSTIKISKKEVIFK